MPLYLRDAACRANYIAITFLPRVRRALETSASAARAAVKLRPDVQETVGRDEAVTAFELDP